MATLFHVLYKTTNLITNAYYIGIHSTNDLNDGYLGSGKILNRSVAKYGKENHKVEVLEFFEDRETLSAKEKEVVNEILLADPLCMNIALGGIGGIAGQCGEKNNFYGKTHSEESRKKISEAGRGRKLSKQTRERMTASKLGKVQYSRPVMAKGIRYESIVAAANAIGMNKTTLGNWIRKSDRKYQEFYYVDQPKDQA